MRVSCESNSKMAYRLSAILSYLGLWPSTGSKNHWHAGLIIILNHWHLGEYKLNPSSSSAIIGAAGSKNISIEIALTRIKSQKNDLRKMGVYWISTTWHATKRWLLNPSKTHLEKNDNGGYRVLLVNALGESTSQQTQKRFALTPSTKEGNLLDLTQLTS